MIRQVRVERGAGIHNGEVPNIYCIDVPKITLENYITSGLGIGAISIPNVYEADQARRASICGLDSYMEHYSTALAQRVQSAFVPKYVPLQEDYSDIVKGYAAFTKMKSNVSMYNAQKAIVQGLANHFGYEKNSILVGEMGIGKTLLAQSVMYASTKKWYGNKMIIMAPGHLVQKWRGEIARFSPNSTSVILRSLKDAISLELNIKNGDYEKTNLFVIVSKETAKLTYDERPVAIWKRGGNCGRVGAFVCPSCGKHLTFKEQVKTGKKKKEYI